MINFEQHQFVGEFGAPNALPRAGEECSQSCELDGTKTSLEGSSNLAAWLAQRAAYEAHSSP
jgi:hypothetical protein